MQPCDRSGLTGSGKALCTPTAQILGTNNEVTGVVLLRGSAVLMGQCQIGGSVLIDGATVGEKTHIKGKTTIGPGSSTEYLSIINHSSIARNVSVGQTCTIWDSVLKNSVQVKKASSIYGASMGKNSEIGPYSTIGRGTKVMPDVIIGEHSCISGGLIISENVGNNMMVNSNDKSEWVSVPNEKKTKLAVMKCVLIDK